MESKAGFQELSDLEVSKFGGVKAGGSKAFEIKSQKLIDLGAREPFVAQRRRQTGKQYNKGRSKIADLL